MAHSNNHVAIVGAGPYGLAAAAHLRAARHDIRVFGRPMEFWQQHMPRGMLLRSSWDASHIGTPDRTLTLNAYQRAQGTRLPKPVPLEQFVAYGRWFQQQSVPDLDRRSVVRIELTANGFRLTLEDGDSIQARRVVVATGIGLFAHLPPEFAQLPGALVSHTSEHHDLSRFAGQHVAVIGGGQSAIETAALLHEAGADVEVILRADAIRWLRRSGWLHVTQNPLRPLLYPPTDVGPPVLNQIVARPDLFRRLPRRLQQRIACRSIRPAASGWLFPRTRDVRITPGRRVMAAQYARQQIRLTLNDRTLRTVDHVMLATGYRVDIQRYPFLMPELRAAIRQRNGYPELAAGFESSVPGLHFLGAPAAQSFGPLMRFVSGTPFAARALAQRISCVRTHLISNVEPIWASSPQSRHEG